MRYLTVIEYVNAPTHGVVRAHQLPNILTGRPKSFPPLTVLQAHEDSYRVVELVAAEDKGDKVDILIEDGNLLSVEKDFYFQRFKE